MSEGGSPVADAPAKPYSRAFENFVDSSGDEPDVVGLIAYALFKQAIREEATTGTIAAGDARNPSATTVNSYKAAAKQLLTGVVDRAFTEATPELQQSALLTAFEGAVDQVKAHVTERTSFGQALLTNVIAWVLTLAIAALILILATRPSLEQTVAGAANRIGVEQKQQSGETGR